MVKKDVFGILIILLSFGAFAQQDPQYSQYLFNQMAINPAYAGSREAIASVMDLRKQWIAMPGAPATAALSLHAPLPKKNIGVGGHLVAESIGPARWTSAHLDVAYRFKLGPGKLSLGLSAGIVNYNFDWTQITLRDQAEIPANVAKSKETKPDANFGFYWYGPTFFIGGSSTHLFQNTLVKGSFKDSLGVVTSTSAIKYATHNYLYLGKGFKISDNMIFSPTILFKTENAKRGNSVDLNFNFLFHEKFWIGMGLRSKYGLVFLTQYYINDKFRIGYSFDLGFNRIGTVGRSSHEIMLGYDLNIFKSKMLSPRYL